MYISACVTDMGVGCVCVSACVCVTVVCVAGGGGGAVTSLVPLPSASVQARAVGGPTVHGHHVALASSELEPRRHAVIFGAASSTGNIGSMAADMEPSE